MEAKDGEVDGEVFNEKVDENAETLPFPGLSDDLETLNFETQIVSNSTLRIAV